MASTRLIPRFQVMAGFVSKAQYPSQMNILSAEWGSVNNVRLLVSSRGSVTANSSLLGADVYNMFVTGQESYTSVQLDGESAKFIYHPPGWGKALSVKGLNTHIAPCKKSSLIELELCELNTDNNAQAELAA